ncbi:MAG: shikimate kinase [Bacteroidota bacterium]
MKRINVIGTSGSGKTTFASALAHQLNYPHIEMDALFWGKNWHESSDDVFFARIAEALDQENWVLDGNYSRTTEVKWQNVDTVIWIDYSFLRTLYQAISRAINRIITQKELWPDTNNRETFQLLFSKDSIVLWMLKTYFPKRKRYHDMIQSNTYPHIQFIRLRSPKACRRFLQRLA